MIKHVLITGMSGTGKSTLSAALREKGYNAIDLDQNRKISWMYERESGKAVDYDFHNDNLEWVQSVEWRWNLDNLQKLISIQTETTFYCGSADNISDVASLFDSIFLLHIDDQTFRDRLSIRTTNSWAKKPEIQEWLLEKKESYETESLEFGAIPLESTQSAEVLVSSILAKAQ